MSDDLGDGRVEKSGRASDRAERPILHVDETRRRRLRPLAIAGAAAVVLVTGGVSLSYTPIFGARVVEVEGEERLGPGRVLRAARISVGTNVVHLDEAAAEARLEAEPWILDASVETALPGTIRISVTERTPLLVIEGDGPRSLVAGDGQLLGRVPTSVSLPEVMAAEGVTLEAPFIRAAGEIVRAMTPVVRSRVRSVTLSADWSVTLVVDGGIEVRYGSVDETTAKAQAIRAILEFAEDEGRGLLSIDVSAPAAPTARFVGSPVPMSAPDPRAPVSQADAHTAPVDAGDHSPSASP